MAYQRRSDLKAGFGKTACGFSAWHPDLTFEIDRDVGFQEILHAERIKETGVTRRQLSRMAPHEPSQECSADLFT
jgi:hypothetical protein